MEKNKPKTCPWHCIRSFKFTSLIMHIEQVAHVHQSDTDSQINLKPWKQPISHPKRLWSSAFETTLVLVINCFKKFTFSLPLEPSKHKLALYKSVRAAELSIYRVLIYTFQMGDYRTVVKHWGITLTLLHPSTLLLPFDGDPACLGGENYELSNKQTKAQKTFKCWLMGRYGANN